MKPPDPLHTGIAAAPAAAVVSVVCAVAACPSPPGTVRFVDSWTHGLDLTAFAVGGFPAWLRDRLAEVPDATGE